MSVEQQLTDALLRGADAQTAFSLAERSAHFFSEDWRRLALAPLSAFVGWALLLRPSLSPSHPAPLRGAGSRATTAERTGGSGGRGTPAVDAVRLASTDFAAQTSFWGPLFVKGSVVLWHGPPKEGKSTLLTECLAALLKSEDFLGWKTAATSCVYFSEETGAIWKGKAARIAGAEAHSRLGWWWRSLWPVRVWRKRRGYRSVTHVPGPSAGHLRGLDNLPALVKAADGYARSVGARLIVLDTLKCFCSEAQSASQHADAFILAMKDLAGKGYCVVVVHHDNDNGAPLGPKSLFGGVDFRVHQSRIKGASRTSTERQIEFDGRFELGGVPEPMRYRLDTDTARLVLSSAEKPREKRGKKDAIIDTPPSALISPTAAAAGDNKRPLYVVPSGPQPADPPCAKLLVWMRVTKTAPQPKADLIKAMVKGGAGSQATVYRHLPHLLEAGLLVESEGKIGVPTTQQEATG